MQKQNLYVPEEAKASSSSYRTLFVAVTIALATYSWALNSLAQEEKRLLLSSEALQQKLFEVDEENRILKEKLSNVKDPSCEEYMLRHYLGLVPRGALQIRFEEPQ